MTTNPTPELRHSAARAFVRSLNILLKFTRMYDFGHPRTAKQYETAWSELSTALGSENPAGLLLAVSGDKLLVDGVALESNVTEKNFAQMFSAAGIASIHFSPKTTSASLAKFVKAFPTSPTAKPGQLIEQLKNAGDPHIHVNEVCFVPADSAVAKSSIAAQLAAHALQMGSAETNELFNDPEKLLQLVMAAEGARSAAEMVKKNGEGQEGGGGASFGASSGTTSGISAGTSAGTTDASGSYNGIPQDLVPANRWTGFPPSSVPSSARPARGGPGFVNVEAGAMPLRENELRAILQVLGQIAAGDDENGKKIDASAFQSRLSTMPRRVRFTVSQALSAIAAQAPDTTSSKPDLLKLAEHVAVRFAMESYQRGDVEVNAVQQMLEEMNQELAGLRKLLGVYEEKLVKAGIEAPSQAETLVREFWSVMPSDKRLKVLESAEAWCVPPQAVRVTVASALARNDTSSAQKMLENYANCITNEAVQARRQTAMGLAELAALYAEQDERLLVETIRIVGVQLAEERDPELHSLVSAAFVRLSQEAARKRSYRGMQRSVELADYVDGEQPGAGQALRSRIEIESRLPEVLEDALRSGQASSDMRNLLRRMPQVAAEEIAGRFGRVGFREDCEFLVALMESLGPEALDHLRQRLQHGNPTEATDTVGILARLDPKSLRNWLPARMKDWKRHAHDRVVRMVAASGSAERGRLLLELFDLLDPMLRPLAVDEIGMAGEQSADMHLLRIAEGDFSKGGTDYLRLKAMEALGRLRTSGAEVVLRKIAEARKTFGWAYPSELRLVAAQAMEKLDPDWVRNFVPRSGLSVAEWSIEALDTDPASSASRQRRYPRLRLDRPLPATTTNLRENCKLEIPELTLGGGVAICEQALHPGSLVELRLNVGARPLKAQTIVRDTNTQARAFEVVDIGLEERAKLRKLLVNLGNAQKTSTPKQRNRRTTRTIFTMGS